MADYIELLAAHDQLEAERDRLKAEVAELCETLKMTRECIAYCRKAHRDVQSGEGVPVERFIDAVLAKHQSPKEPPA